MLRVVVITVLVALLAWAGAGLLASSLPVRSGYHAGRWRLAGAALGPLTIPVWIGRRGRERAAAEVVDAGWPAAATPGLLVVPTRGPTPQLVRAICDLRVRVGHVALARVIPFDSPSRDVARERDHLRGDRSALGLPAASLLLLRGQLGKAIVAHAERAAIPVVLVDGEIDDAGGSVQVLRPDDVQPAPRAPAVRVLARSERVDLDAMRLARRRNRNEGQATRPVRPKGLTDPADRRTALKMWGPTER